MANEKMALKNLLDWIEFTVNQESEIEKVNYSAIRELNYEPLNLN